MRGSPSLVNGGSELGEQGMPMPRGPGYMIGRLRHWVRESLRSWLWGLMLPLSILCSLFWSHGWSLLGGVTYLALGLKICLRKRLDHTWQESILYAIFCTMGKIPEAQGQMQFHWQRITGRTCQIMEYRTTVD
ncbi:hypothetical protein [Acaryochloris sp. IP29b_bin.137]|uniref:hypothetical protein n=1 Tax=Acaryochloris sp. IP29b_bin.137 TaxID=2969217 RepID=UPI0026318E3F|nr:hypothetical protein [Acaryochloris sp. IP29b_bin.137]